MKCKKKKRLKSFYIHHTYHITTQNEFLWQKQFVTSNSGSKVKYQVKFFIYFFFWWHKFKWTRAINCFVFLLSCIFYYRLQQNWWSRSYTKNVGMECSARGLKANTWALVELWGARSISTLFAWFIIYCIYFLLTYWKWSRHLGLHSVSQ